MSGFSSFRNSLWEKIIFLESSFEQVSGEVCRPVVGKAVTGEIFRLFKKSVVQSSLVIYIFNTVGLGGESFVIL